MDGLAEPFRKEGEDVDFSVLAHGLGTGWAIPPVWDQLNHLGTKGNLIKLWTLPWLVHKS